MDVKDIRIIEIETLLHAALREENARLRTRIAKLEKHSGNSSKPPSSDIVKPPKKGVARRKGKNAKRKRGGQKGHAQHLRKPFDASQIDAVVELTMERCPDCGHALSPCSQSPQVVQQAELAPKPVVLTEYRQGRFRCEKCQCHHTAPLPPEVANSGLFGPKLTTLVAYCKGRCHMSYTTTQAFFAEMFQLDVSTGFLTKQVRKVSAALLAQLLCQQYFTSTRPAVRKTAKDAGFGFSAPRISRFFASIRRAAVRF